MMIVFFVTALDALHATDIIAILVEIQVVGFATQKITLAISVGIGVVEETAILTIMMVQ